MKTEGAKNGIEAVPFPVGEAPAFLLLQAIEIQVSLIAAILRVMADLGVGLLRPVCCHVVAGVIVSAFKGLGGEFSVRGAGFIAVEEILEDLRGQGCSCVVRGEHAFDRPLGAAIRRAPEFFEELRIKLAGAIHRKSPRGITRKQCLSPKSRIVSGGSDLPGLCIGAKKLKISSCPFRLGYRASYVVRRSLPWINCSRRCLHGLGGSRYWSKPPLRPAASG